MLPWQQNSRNIGVQTNAEIRASGVQTSASGVQMKNKATCTP